VGYAQKTEASAAYAEARLENRRGVQKMQREAARSAINMPVLTRFISMLKQEYGTVLRAWIQVLDRKGLERVPFAEFKEAVATTPFDENVLTLWQVVDADNRGFVTLGDFDKDAYELFEEFRESVLPLYGKSWLRCWYGKLDTDQTGYCTEEDFLDAVDDWRTIDKVLKWSRKQGEKFFHLLDVDGGGTLELEEIDPQSAVSAQEFEPKPRPQKTANLPFLERQMKTASYLVKREEARKQREALKNDELNVSKLTFGSYQRWLLKKGPDAFD
jgi:Ca2+-binding EF-hand superfamily protein